MRIARGQDALANETSTIVGEAMANKTVTDWNGQIFDVMRPEDRPQDTDGDGRSLRFTTHERDEMAMPQAIEVADAEGRWAIYVPLEIDGKMGELYG